jgi:quercetin dioxygenase-like cupin family protein
MPKMGAAGDTWPSVTLVLEGAEVAEARSPDLRGAEVRAASGYVRLQLGNEDWVLGPGEVAEFETQVPHWFGSLGQEPAEILSILARFGERMNIRVGPARE